MEYVLRSARYIASCCLEQVVKAGDTVIDATVGNGHDTCMLAKLVGKNGKVYGFDLQQSAIDSAVKLLMSESEKTGEDLISRCSLICSGHQNIREYVSVPVKAAVFNLGWLPGGDKSITTHWSTTHTAVENALNLLETGGVCTICAYPGHAAGEEERISLMEYLSTLRPQEFTVLHHKFLNAGAFAPECFIIQKNPE